MAVRPNPPARRNASQIGDAKAHVLFFLYRPIRPIRKLTKFGESNRLVASPVGGALPSFPQDVGVLMMIFDLLDELKQGLNDLEPDQLEHRYRVMAEDEAGPKVAKLIADANVSDYEGDLADGIAQAMDAADESGCEAILFEYDMDGDWAGWFYVCPDYEPESAEDEDWADEREEQVEGPAHTTFARIFAKHGGLDDDDAKSATTLYLIARTMACQIGRASWRERV